LAWGTLVLGGAGLAGLFVAAQPPAPRHVLRRDKDQLVLASPSGFQTVSMLDGGRTGLYYDAAEDLLRGQPHIERVLLLGLGGGEMLRGARRAQPRATLVGVEIDEKTARLARSAFAAPADEIYVADAIDWIAEQPAHSYSVVMVDLYNDSLIVEAATRTVFLADCARALRASGLFIMNVWPAERAAEIDAHLQPFFVTAQRSYGPNAILIGAKRP
jgi:spermidine synthase